MSREEAWPHLLSPFSPTFLTCLHPLLEDSQTRIRVEHWCARSRARTQWLEAGFFQCIGFTLSAEIRAGIKNDPWPLISQFFHRTQLRLQLSEWGGVGLGEVALGWGWSGCWSGIEGCLIGNSGRQGTEGGELTTHLVQGARGGEEQLSLYFFSFWNTFSYLYGWEPRLFAWS